MKQFSGIIVGGDLAGERLAHHEVRFEYQAPYNLMDFDERGKPYVRKMEYHFVPFSKGDQGWEEGIWVSPLEHPKLCSSDGEPDMVAIAAFLSASYAMKCIKH